MRIALILMAILPLFVEYTIAGKVYTVHDYRRVNVNRNTATVRRLGNTYVFPRYRASSRSSLLRCRYGGYRRECCAGWSRNRDGSCSPICTNNCVHGTCVGPDMCKCDKGYTGKSCNRDLNECGLEPRPCDHRCTNTHGSFKCYCERGFILLEDKRTCVRDERCYPGRCSHGCAFRDNEVTCVCPPGLRLIEDGYHCKDIDECAEGLVTCPTDQECKNTFGNFLCVCKEGFQFQYIDGKYQCVAAGCESLGYECHPDAYCGYIDLRPECICNEGYWGNGRICLPARIRDCSSLPCFPGVVCTNEFEDIREISGYPPEGIFDQFRCGACPPGYTGDGIDCEDINECDEGTNNCDENAECINEPGSFRCECLEGYHGNGEVCVLISPFGCDSCFPGTNCQEVPLPDPNDVALLSTLDIIYLFDCGPCPTGYEGDGTICLDINECDIEPQVTNCHVNADCENVPGGYLCVCSDGFFGNGTHCSLLDPRTCDDNPCSPFAECIPVDPDDLNFLLPFVQLFQCGPCQEGFQGDGYNCTQIPKEIVDPFVNLTVLVLADDPPEGDPILSAAFVRTFVSDPSSQSGTREHRRARTADNGMVVLECPHNESIIVTGNHPQYFSNSVTFRCNLKQTNVVTLLLHKPYEDTIYVYHPDSPREFGVGNDTLNERYSTYFPEDSFEIPDNRRVQVLFRSVNVSVTSELELAPEMIACIPRENEQPGRGDVGAPSPREDDIDIRAIETFGAVELTVRNVREGVQSRGPPPFKDDKKMILTFPVQKLPSDLEVGDKVPAWTFDFNSGCWEQDGEGELTIDEATDNLVWRYEANHFSWWAAGRVNPRTSCVNVRTCYDRDCARPAPDTLVRIFGKDYGFETFRYTDTDGETCIQFPFGRTVELSSTCSNDPTQVIVVESTENPSSCDGGRNEIPKVPDYQTREGQDSCREAVLVVPETRRSCEAPNENHNNLVRDSTSTREYYRYTDVEHYSCANKAYKVLTEGNGNRVCQRCYTWTDTSQCEEVAPVQGFDDYD